MTQAQTIEIHNFNEGETVCYRVVLIKGNLSAGDDHRIFCSTGTSGTRLEFPVFRNNFKCLALLERGENRVLLECGGARRELNLRWVPRDTRLCVTPVYLVCRDDDGRFQAPAGTDNSATAACSRIATGAALVQCIFAEKLREKGFGRKTFQLENDLVPGAPACRVFRSRLSLEEARSMSQLELWQSLGRELMSSELGSHSRKFMAFLSCTVWDGETVYGDAALSNGGLALLGTGCLHTWPKSVSEVVQCFTDTTKLGSDLLDNSCYRGTYGGCFSTTLGSTCHEVGHMFNLGHPETGIMSRGFDNTHRVFLAGGGPKEADSALIGGGGGGGGARCKGTPPKVSVTIIPELRVVGGDHPKPTAAHSPMSNVRNSSHRLTNTDSASVRGHNDDDLTYWSPGCAAILAHHKWFNNAPEQESNIIYDSTRNVVMSEAGLRVVQLRSECGAVKKSWEMESSKSRHMVVPRLASPASSTLIAVDTNGTILTASIN